MPQQLDKDVILKVELAVQGGEWPSEAAKRLFGVSPKTWGSWWARGVEFYDDADKSGLDPHDRLCVELVGRVWVAEAEWENRMRKAWQQSLENGKAGVWLGFKTLLELRQPDRWRKREMEKASARDVAPEEEFRRLAEAEKAKRS